MKRGRAPQLGYNCRIHPAEARTMSIQDTIREQVTTHPVVLYMKGTPQFPQCGFSSAAVQMLKASGDGDLLFRQRPRRSGHPAGDQGLRQLADDSAALRQRRIRRRRRHHARDVRIGRTAAAAGEADCLISCVVQPGRSAYGLAHRACTSLTGALEWPWPVVCVLSCHRFRGRRLQSARRALCTRP